MGPMRCFQTMLLLVVAALPVRGAEQTTVLFLGDSITAGRGVGEDAAYPALLERRWRAAGKQRRVINAGISGDTSKGGAARIGFLLRSEPDWVVVALGGNDALRGLPPERLGANLAKIIEASRKAGVRVALLGMRAPPNMGETYQRDFAAVYPALAERHAVPLYPFLLEGVAGDRELNQRDRIHPTRAGQKVLADRIGAFLEPLLDPPPPVSDPEEPVEAEGDAAESEPADDVADAARGDAQGDAQGATTADEAGQGER
ncbi:MAG: arylesterase [Planctomycetota bacterium]